MLEGNTDDDESGMSIKRDMKGSRIDSGVAYIREDFKQAVQLHIFYPPFLKKLPFFKLATDSDFDLNYNSQLRNQYSKCV